MARTKLSTTKLEDSRQISVYGVNSGGSSWLGPQNLPLRFLLFWSPFLSQVLLLGCYRTAFVCDLKCTVLTDLWSTLLGWQVWMVRTWAGEPQKFIWVYATIASHGHADQQYGVPVWLVPLDL